MGSSIRLSVLQQLFDVGVTTFDSEVRSAFFSEPCLEHQVDDIISDIIAYVSAVNFIGRYLSEQEEETEWGRSFQSGVDRAEEETRWVTPGLLGRHPNDLHGLVKSNP